MEKEIKVPAMGESITEATVAAWHVQPGSSCCRGDILVELETDKVTLELPSPSDGMLKEIKHPTGDTVAVGDVLALFQERTSQEKTSQKGTPQGKQEQTSSQQPSTAKASATPPVPEAVAPNASSQKNETLAPGAARFASEHGLDPSQIRGSGKRGQVTKEDLVRSTRLPTSSSPTSAVTSNLGPTSASPMSSPEERERVVTMSRLRKRIAERLVGAQKTSAILTTFNEIDMSNAMALRKSYKEMFQKKYGVGIGFISIFTKASIHALREVPAVNAEIRGDQIIYKNYYDIGVAVGGPRGLVVPVIRDAGRLSFAGIEMEIMRLAERVRTGTIEISEMEGGTFTISNGGIYGSMLSTPILNPPQSGILGMHNIVKRPVVNQGDEIVVRPIMYIALSYDHRIIDGKEAVTFLVKVKEAVENPERMLLEI